MASTSNTNNSDRAPPGHTPARRSPTDSSYYDFDGVPYDNEKPNSATWMYARDARAQQAGIPTARMKSRYPSKFRNSPDNVELSTPGTPGYKNNPEWLHHPLIPGTTKTYTSGPPGAVRSVYTKGNPNEFDVMHHDPKAGTSPRGDHLFAKSHYYPAAQQERSQR
ncbi:hypothetical protein F4806DRAFT_481877 [Annulohypoxylon nitens]|nr:hypothetical protein F4806DRAFT_481877 [Annulohypoxylon nitens]